MIRVALPQHLQTLARVGAEVEVEVPGPVTQRAVLDALEDNGANQDSSFSPEERALLKNILSLRGKRVDDVMVPRADIVAGKVGREQTAPKREFD